VCKLWINCDQKNFNISKEKATKTGLWQKTESRRYRLQYTALVACASELRATTALLFGFELSLPLRKKG